MLYLDDDQLKFVKLLVKRLDLVNEFSGFLNDHTEANDCIDVGHLIQNHVDANKVFEMIIDGNKIPIILDDNLTKHLVAKPLSLTTLAFLCTLTTFLSTSRYGINIDYD